MARSWTDVRRDAVAAGLINEDDVGKARSELIKHERAFRLAEIRRGQDLSQKQLAESMHVSQARVSTIERGQLTRIELGTLEAYVEALGGHLRIVVDFEDQSLVVRD